MLTDGIQLSRPLAVVWIVPAIAAMVVLAFQWRPAARARTVLIVRLMCVGYLVAVVILTLWPLHFDATSTGLEKGNWDPFGGSLGWLSSDNEIQRHLGGRDVLANVVAFVPLGLLLPFVLTRTGAVTLSILILVFLTFSLEMTQGFAIAQRTFDIDDPIAGLVGGVCAVIVAGWVRYLSSFDRNPR
jgi:glycopeptide antibiotics resistance protein